MKKRTLQYGFSLVEVILAVAIFSMIAVTGVATVLHSFSVNRLGDEESEAYLFAQAGIEAVRSIKNQGWGNLTEGVHGLKTTGDIWSFEGVDNSQDKFTRQVLISPAPRNVSGDIVDSGGTPDADTKKVTSTVTWNFSSARPENISIITYLTNFRKAIVSGRGGMLVYGNGGTTSDAVIYKILDGAGNWSSTQPVADIDAGTSNRYLRSARLFASATRNEKILVSRHYDGASQYIYAQVYNGTTSSWGHVQLLSNWAATNYLDVRNFDGTYLANGNFMVVYRDGTTTIPKYQIWDGINWGPQTNTTNIGGVPNYITARSRPGTNEVMLVTYDQASDTNTAYYNGTNWTTAVEHAAAGPTATKEHVDFAWSAQNSLKGALVYPSVAADTTVNLKIWTANESGGGSWSGTVDSGASGARLGSIDIDGRKGVEEWLSCQKDANNDIYCFRANSTPSWAIPTNNILTITSDTGIQRSFDVAYEAMTGTEGIAVYSNNNSTPVYRLYTASTNSFGAQINLTTALGGSLETVRTRALSDNDDIMLAMADTNQDLYTVVWDGANNAVYTSGGKARTTHGLSGSNDLDYWFDFAWDRF